MISSRASASVIGACAVVLALAAPGVTHADSIDQRPAEVVRFADINLDTRAGVGTLFQRLQTAATRVCRQFEPLGTRVPSPAHKNCMREAVSGAVRTVDSPLLTAFYNEREGHSLTTASR